MSENKKATGGPAENQPVEAAGEGFVMLMSNVENVLGKSKNALVALHRKTQAAAAPAVAKARITLSFGTNRGKAGAKTLYDMQLKPGAKGLAAAVRTRLSPKALTREYGKALLFINRFGGDRKVERLFFVPTSRTTKLSVLRVPHQLRHTGHDYRPTPRRVFEWAMAMTPEAVDRFAFVDFGAGRGRVLLMASHYPFERILGAEIAEELHRDCLLNIAQYPRSLMKCRDVDCQHLSALRLDLPDQESVFYFNNPFDLSMFERVVEQIAKSYRQQPRRFYVICVDMAAGAVLEDTGIFERVRIAPKLRAKVALFSPYSIAIYRTVPRDAGDDAAT